MKRTVSVILAVVTVLTLLAGCGSTQPEETQAQPVETAAPTKAPRVFADPELSRADGLGLIPQDWTEDSLDEDILGGEYYDLLTKVVELYAPENLSQWEELAGTAKGSDDKVYTADKLAGLYMAACAMGIGETTNGKWNPIQEWLFPTRWNTNRSASVFTNAGEISPFCANYHNRQHAEWDYVTAGGFFVQGQFSQISGEPLLNYELYATAKLRDKAPVLDRAFKRSNAIRSALRLYESTYTPIVTEATEPNAAALYSAADERREAILNSATEITYSDSWEQGKTYSGTAYYVSNEGSDSNDGKSPETPWQSLEKVNRANLKEGDAVFFRRGDTWYGQLWGKSGVTYSAYGEGNKPLFSGSIEGIANAENWTLHYEEGSGQKIWVYKDILSDVSGILMNDNSKWAEKLIPGWNGEYYVNQDGSEMILEEAFTEDLMFFSALNLQGQSASVDIENGNFKGEVYLRCDKGNPGEVFSDIQFIYGGGGFSPNSMEREFGYGCTADNLAFYYHSGAATGCAGYQGWTGTLIQNCEIGWSGGVLQTYGAAENFGFGKASFSGGAIHCAGSDNTVQNNYIHDCDSKVFIMTIHYRGDRIPTTYENTKIIGNLVERSGAALHLMSCMFMYDTDRLGTYKDMVYEDNYIMDTGFGWCKRKIEQSDIYLNHGQQCNIGLIGLNDGILENVQIRNNVFCGSVYALVGTLTDRDNFPIFSGNTYAQYENGWVADVNGSMLTITENAQEQIADWLGDTAAKTVVIR